VIGQQRLIPAERHLETTGTSEIGFEITNPYIQSDSMNAELGTEVDEECRCFTQSTLP
jgi:hypothetical protein